MMKTMRVVTPVGEDTIKALTVGDVVYISGQVYTARDMAHIRMMRSKNEGAQLPFNLRGGIIFHAGPVVKKQDGSYSLSVIGPTTSIRMEPYSDFIGELGVKMIIGKGGMGEGTIDALKRHRMVYLQAPPGCAVFLGEKVKRIKEVHWIELGVPEAVWVLAVEAFGPLIVSMDSFGSSVYKDIQEDGKATIKRKFETVEV
jgi:tartrate/fumarate subfamily iron-sulfur-dependent hydro-lyase beta chain